MSTNFSISSNGIRPAHSTQTSSDWSLRGLYKTIAKVALIALVVLSPNGAEASAFEVDPRIKKYSEKGAKSITASEQVRRLKLQKIEKILTQMRKVKLGEQENKQQFRVNTDSGAQNGLEEKRVKINTQMKGLQQKADLATRELEKATDDFQKAYSKAAADAALHMIKEAADQESSSHRKTSDGGSSETYVIGASSNDLLSKNYTRSK